jgi:hypothetical protein
MIPTSTPASLCEKRGVGGLAIIARLILFKSGASGELANNARLAFEQAELTHEPTTSSRLRVVM